jgi:TonB family protein
MGYQALLFCPEEKLARIVSQVFSELDFTVEPVHEPFAAVKKLMSQRYDAIVVDCENEQNASLLFKSARNSSSNQNSLAIALVEGQSGVAKSYRIGANLVLTKPINVEQAKGTLRVARGLLRKNQDAAASASTLPVAAAKATSPVAGNSGQTPRIEPANPAHLDRNDVKTLEAVASATLPMPPAVALPASAPAARALDMRATAAAPVAKTIQEVNSISSSASGSAAAAVPAKEEALPVKQAADFYVSDYAASESATVPNSVGHTPTFGALDEEENEGSQGNKKLLIAAVILLAVAALGYFGYTKISNGSVAQVPQNASTYDSGQTAPAASPISSPVTSSTNTPSRTNSSSSSSSSKTSALKSATVLPSEKRSVGNTNSSAIQGERDAEPVTVAPAPVHVKSSIGASKKQIHSEEVAPPPPSTIASASDNRLSSLIASSAPNLPKPSLTTLRVSQGVSQGLLIKRVQPKYPQAALAAHTQGAVQIEATINKEGSVINPKVVHGDPVLARAALDAVRQWRYKPYYLDGEPVEIQTEISITFKSTN